MSNVSIQTPADIVAAQAGAVAYGAIVAPPAFSFGINLGSLSGKQNNGQPSTESNVGNLEKYLGAIWPLTDWFRAWFDDFYACPSAVMANAIIAAGKKVLAVQNAGNDLGKPINQSAAETATEKFLSACPGLWGIEFCNEANSSTYWWPALGIPGYVTAAIAMSKIVRGAGKQFICANPTSGLSWLQAVAAECIKQGTTFAAVFTGAGCHDYTGTWAQAQPMRMSERVWLNQQKVMTIHTEFETHALGNGTMPTSLTPAQATAWGADTAAGIIAAGQIGGCYGHFGLTQNFTQHAGPCGILLPNGQPNQPFFNDVLAALQAVKAAA